MLENENFYPPTIITLSSSTNSNLLTFSQPSIKKEMGALTLLNLIPTNSTGGIDQPSAASVGTQGHLQSADQLTVEMPTWPSEIQNNNNNSGSQSQDQGHLSR